MSYQASPEDAVRSAGRLIKEAGVDCVKIEGGKYFAEHVRCLKGAGIPVMGHIGLTPQSASALGGFKLQGKTKQEAQELIEDAVALDEAGAFGMVLECMPAGLVKKITETVDAVTISTGSGPYADGFNLNAYDLLGIFDQFVPKFVEQYKKLGPEIIDGFNAFTQGVRDKKYPGPQHTFQGSEEIRNLYPH
jgi:3-methyl-2-oxobutanoate hydroxymethyltransferase